jgi:hypothetical protein
MPLVPQGTTITGAGITGCVISIDPPAREVKVLDATCLADTIETFLASTQLIGSELAVTKYLDTPTVVGGDADTIVITIPDTVPVVITFDGFVKSAKIGTIAVGDTTAVTEELVITVTTVTT